MVLRRGTHRDVEKLLELSEGPDGLIVMFFSLTDVKSSIKTQQVLFGSAYPAA